MKMDMMRNISIKSGSTNQLLSLCKSNGLVRASGIQSHIKVCRIFIV